MPLATPMQWPTPENAGEGALELATASPRMNAVRSSTASQPARTSSAISACWASRSTSGMLDAVTPSSARAARLRIERLDRLEHAHDVEPDASRSARGSVAACDALEEVVASRRCSGSPIGDAAGSMMSPSRMLARKDAKRVDEPGLRVVGDRLVVEADRLVQSSMSSNVSMPLLADDA